VAHRRAARESDTVSGRDHRAYPKSNSIASCRLSYCNEDMTTQGGREDWLADVDQRQRNTLPHDLYDKAKFWRNLYRSDRKLSTLQRVGVRILLAGAVAGIFGLIAIAAWDPHGGHFSFEQLFVFFLAIMTVVALMAAFLAVLSWSQTRSGHKSEQ
jgi:hypothetical protein